MRTPWMFSLPALAAGGVLLLGSPRGGASAADDAATVADVDTRYQAAVKANDWAGMDAILADDFVLVTGTGQTYSKADLLAEARGKTMVYEHQEDTRQTVRLWGGQYGGGDGVPLGEGH